MVLYGIVPYPIYRNLQRQILGELWQEKMGAANVGYRRYSSNIGAKVQAVKKNLLSVGISIRRNKDTLE